MEVSFKTKISVAPKAFKGKSVQQLWKLGGPLCLTEVFTHTNFLKELYSLCTVLYREFKVRVGLCLVSKAFRLRFDLFEKFINFEDAKLRIETLAAAATQFDLKRRIARQNAVSSDFHKRAAESCGCSNQRSWDVVPQSLGRNLGTRTKILKQAQ